MSVSELKDRANREWSRSPELQYHYHTFEYYWWERYARVYLSRHGSGLPGNTPIGP